MEWRVGARPCNAQFDRGLRIADVAGVLLHDEFVEPLPGMAMDVVVEE